MPSDRYVITDRQGSKIAQHWLGKKTGPGRTGSDGRLFLEGVFWSARTGAQWRDLPGEFGKWNTVYRQFRDWARACVFQRIFNALSEVSDMEMAMIDGEPSERRRHCLSDQWRDNGNSERQWRGIVKVQRHGQGSKGGPSVRL